MPFSALGLDTALVQRAYALGWTQPTAVQQTAIPAILQGRDVRGGAPTGSGKTAAYCLPLLQSLLHHKSSSPRQVRGLVLVPTRELAVQVDAVLRQLVVGQNQRLKISVAIGGVSINPQMLALRGGADVVVATPGRLLDLLDHNAVHLDGVETLVLDEADRLLDLGFSEELTRILAMVPMARQNLLFSATFPPAVQAMENVLLRDPVRIEVAAEGVDKPDIVQHAIAVDAAQRTPLLRHLVKEHGWTRVLVFVATRYAAERVAEKLYKHGIFATPFHGELSQGARKQVLDEFKDERWEVVVTTDLAARGLDIVQLPVVVNYDLPRSPTDYLHRIGRTGRSGTRGLAVSFVSADTESHFRLIERRQGLSLAREQIAGFEPQQTVPSRPDHAAVPGTGGVKGKRPSKKDKLRAAATLVT